MPATRSKTSVRLAGVLLPLLGATVAASAQPDLARYVDKSRVLLVFARSADDPSFSAQKKIIEDARGGTAERALVLVPALGKEAADLHRRYGVADDSFAAFLIGKDGETKMRSAQPIAARTLFSTIDAMPMRRAERAR